MSSGSGLSRFKSATRKVSAKSSAAQAMNNPHSSQNSDDIQKLNALVNAVEKNAKFRQLASYSINVLTKAARAHDGLDVRASNVVMAALAEHPKSLEVLSCASDCLAALAEDSRQAYAIAEGSGLTMGLTMALQLKDDGSSGAVAGDPVAKALLLFEKVGKHARCVLDRIDDVGHKILKCYISYQSTPSPFSTSPIFLI